MIRAMVRVSVGLCAVAAVAPWTGLGPGISLACILGATLLTIRISRHWHEVERDAISVEQALMGQCPHVRHPMPQENCDVCSGRGAWGGTL